MRLSGSCTRFPKNGYYVGLSSIDHPHRLVTIEGSFYLGGITQYPCEAYHIDNTPTNDTILDAGKRGIPAKPCAIPIVKGFKIAPAKPNPAAIKTIHTPVMESYPIDIAIGTKTRQKAMVSSLIPNTAPNILKSSMMAVNKKLSMPILRRMGLFSILRAFRRKLTVPISNALLSFTIQNAPPMMRMKTMISALSTNPL